MQTEWRKLRADELREQARAMRSSSCRSPRWNSTARICRSRSTRCWARPSPPGPPRRSLAKGQPVAGAAGAVDRAVGTSHELRRHRHPGQRRLRRAGRGRGAVGPAPRLPPDRAAERAWRQRKRAAHHHRRPDPETRRADRAVHLLVCRCRGDRQDPGDPGRPAARLRGGDIDDDGGAA